MRSGGVRADLFRPVVPREGRARCVATLRARHRVMGRRERLLLAVCIDVVPLPSHRSPTGCGSRCTVVPRSARRSDAIRLRNDGARVWLDGSIAGLALASLSAAFVLPSFSRRRRARRQSRSSRTLRTRWATWFSWARWWPRSPPASGDSTACGAASRSAWRHSPSPTGSSSSRTRTGRTSWAPGSTPAGCSQGSW